MNETTTDALIPIRDSTQEGWLKLKTFDEGLTPNFDRKLPTAMFWKVINSLKKKYSTNLIQT